MGVGVGSVDGRRVGSGVGSAVGVGVGSGVGHGVGTYLQMRDDPELAPPLPELMRHLRTRF